MSIPDLVNGLFEFGGSLAISASVFRLAKDKQVKGVAWSMVAFFWAWGIWNIFYYPHLGQNLSFLAGICVVSVNTIYLAMLLYYSRKGA
ncbi:MAG: hypothetical protein AB7R40_23115 [Nitrospiraceae bacterium]